MTANLAVDEDNGSLMIEEPESTTAVRQDDSTEPSTRTSTKGLRQDDDASATLAEVCEAVLDDEQLRELLSDIATYGKVRELSVKAAPRARPDHVNRLPELYLKLVQRRVFGAQIRYELEERIWLDTLIATPEGLRLVRVELPQ